MQPNTSGAATLMLLVLCAVAGGHGLAFGAALGGARQTIMAGTDYVSTLSGSDDPKALVHAAQGLATSDQPPDHSALLGFLRQESFLLRLDSEEAYDGKPERLRLRRVLESLAKNDAPSAHAVLDQLTQDRTFIGEPQRVDLLIQVSSALRPPADEVIRFWDNHCQPEDGYCHLTVEAIVENGDPRALAVLESKFADPDHEEDDKLAWMQSSILTHRNDLALLEMCHRLLAGTLPPDLRPSLVEVLYDYQPERWFRPHQLLTPPDRATATPAALAQMRQTAALVLSSVALNGEQKAAVERTLEEIDQLEQVQSPKQ